METWLSKPTLGVVCIHCLHDCEWESRQLDQIAHPSVSVDPWNHRAQGTLCSPRSSAPKGKRTSHVSTHLISFSF